MTKFKNVGKLIYYILAGGLPTFIAWIVSFRELPLASGFVTFPLQDNALIPYRDYFDPVPPLTYFEAHITASANFGLHNYMALTLLVVPVFGIACFSLAKIFLGNLGSLFFVVLMETLLVSERLEQVGGWNSQFLMLMSIGFILFIHGVLSRLEHNADNSVSTFKMRSTALASGFFFSLAIIEKQTCVLTLVLVLILLIPWMYWERSEGFVRCISHTGFLSILGTIPVFLFTFYFLISNHALTFFISDMLSGGGKNPNFLSFPSEAFHAILVYLPIKFMIGTVCVFAALYLWKRFRPGFPIGFENKYLYEIIYFFIVFTCSFVLWQFSGTFSGSYTLTFLELDVLASLLLLLLNHYVKGISSEIKGTIALLALLLLPIIVNWRIGGSLFEFISRIGATGSFQISLNLFIILFSTILLLPKRFQRIASKQFSIYFNETSLTFAELKFLVIFANMFSVAAFINLFSSGGSIFIQWFIPQAIIYFSLIILLFKNIARRIPLQNFGALWLYLLTCTTLAITFNNPYAWFNWSEMGVLTAHTSSNLPNNFGFQLSTPAYFFYSRITVDALRAATLTGKGSSATVFSYPNIPTAATATGLQNYTGIKCVVLWFDTCPNNQAAADLVTFASNPPNVIIWEPIPPSMMAGNEVTFVRGRSALEDWENYRLHEVATGKWVQIDSFVSPLSNGWTTYVYAVV